MRKIGTEIALLAAAVVLAFASSAPAGWWDDVGDAEKVDLADVIDAPREYRGREITFTCTFHEVSEHFNPYYTRFIPAHYLNFAVWPASKRIWRKGDYLESFAFLFIERDHQFASTLLQLDKYTQLKLTGYVQNAFKNVPWIEVRQVEVLDESMTQDTLKNIIRGDDAAEKGDAEAALRHFDQAAASGLPAEVAASVEKKRAAALVDLGRREEARQAAETALRFQPEDAEAKKLLLDLGGVLPEAPAIPGGESPVADSSTPDESEPPAPAAEPAPEVVPPVELRMRPLPPNEPQTAPAPEAPVSAHGNPAAAEPRPGSVSPSPPAEEEPAEPVKRTTPRKRLSGPM